MPDDIQCKIQVEDFDLSVEYQRLRTEYPDAGAITTFSGLVRELAEPGQVVQSLELQTYPALASEQIKSLAAKAFSRFDLLGLTIIHRYGSLQPCEQIVFVGVASKHRRDSFAAAEMLMDHLKSCVAFWKREQATDADCSKSQWIEVKQSDLDALKRWE